MSATIKNQTFGIEIEFYGLSRYNASRVVESVVGGHIESNGARSYKIVARDGRAWKVVYDGSIVNARGEQCELVSPILTYEDIETVQEIVRALRVAGMGVNDSCGIHIHVGADKHDARSLKNLSNIFYSKQDIMFRALGLHASRVERWCKPLEMSFIEKLKENKPSSVREIGRVWYGSDPSLHRAKYDSSRYRGLNLHSVFMTGTVEFRCFNATSHAGRIKAYIQFCLAISTQAINSRSARSTVTTSTNEKYTFRTWLIRLGLNGEEFKTARHHLLANLEGDIAWRNAQ